MFDTLETARPPSSPEIPAVDEFVAQAWPHHRAPYRPPAGLAEGIEAIAEVNHGRWIVRCPFCPGAQLASEAERRFFCVDCLHGRTPAEGRWIAVRWPSDRTRVRAEGLLSVRQDPGARNFDPRGERLEDLRRENAEHGVG